MIIMINKLLFFVIITCNLIYGLYEIEYNAAIEIQEILDNNIDDYKLQYNLDDKDPISWNNFSYNNSEKQGNIKYLASGLFIDSVLTNKSVALRLVNNFNVSDVHYINIVPELTTFIKISLKNGTNFSSQVYSRHTNNLPYSEIYFHVKPKNNFWVNLIRLIFPYMYDLLTPNSIMNFTWELINCDIENASLFLIILNDNDTILSKTNVTGLSGYSINMSEDVFPCGKYWWMISVEDNIDCIICSEKRCFYISNSVDSDSDGYNDTVEIARDSNPYDPRDIPLIIISDPVCSNSYYGQQYYNILKVNDEQNRVYWNAPGILPSGLILSQEGVLFGIPRETGVFLFDVEVLNEIGKRDIKRFYMNIKDPNQSQIKSGVGAYTNKEN